MKPSIHSGRRRDMHNLSWRKDYLPTRNRSFQKTLSDITKEDAVDGSVGRSKYQKCSYPTILFRIFRLPASYVYL